MKIRQKRSTVRVVSLLVSAGLAGVLVISLLLTPFVRSGGDKATAGSEEAGLQEAERAPVVRAATLAALPAAPKDSPSEDSPSELAPGDPGLLRAERTFDDLAKGLDPALLERLHSDTERGRRIARLALYPRIAPLLDSATAELLRASYVPDLRAHPTEAIREVRGLMSKVDSLAYAQERLALYSVLTAVPDVRSTMEELSYKDLTTLVPAAQPDPRGGRLTIEQQEAALSWGPDRVLPLMAYNYYMVATQNDPDLALDGTVDAVVAQADSAIREGIVSGFVTAHPELKAPLYAELAKKSVSIADVQPVVAQPTSIPDPSQVPFKPVGPKPPSTGG